MSAMKTLKTTAAVSVGALAFGALAATSASAVPQHAPSSPATQVAGPNDDWNEDEYAGDERGRDKKDRGRGKYDPLGKVVSRIDLNVRTRPDTDGRVVGSLRPGKVVKLDCKVIGEKVDGNKRWYKLEDRKGWVAARYVKNLDHVPWC